MTKTITKKQRIIDCMVKHQKLSYLEVCQKLTEEVEIPFEESRKAYCSFLRKGWAPGKLDKPAKTTKPAKPVKASKEVKGKSQIEKLLAGTEKLTQRGNDVIKQRNLDTMKAVSTADQKRRRELADFEMALQEEIDSRTLVPKFLHKELGLL